MAEVKPSIYILHGEDEFEITQTIARLEKNLGDPATASMNTTRLDGNVFQMEQLLTIAGAMPFLAPRRLVILTHPLARLGDDAAKGKFLRQLEQIPPTTALVLVENHLLKPQKKKNIEIDHFLVDWTKKTDQRVWIKGFPLPQKGSEWQQRITDLAKQAGGQISPGAAELLFELLDGDVRLANQEVLKLLAYVNYRRIVEPEDVEAITADVGQGDIFAMVDAVGYHDGRKALGMLRRLMEYQDYFSIFGMLVRQFRLLVQTREILDGGGGDAEVIRVLKSKYTAKKIIPQARLFTLKDLKKIYSQLLETDEAYKTSLMTDELALETLVVSLTS